MRNILGLSTLPRKELRGMYLVVGLLIEPKMLILALVWNESFFPIARLWHASGVFFVIHVLGLNFWGRAYAESRSTRNAGSGTESWKGGLKASLPWLQKHPGGGNEHRDQGWNGWASQPGFTSEVPSEFRFYRCERRAVCLQIVSRSVAPHFPQVSSLSIFLSLRKEMLIAWMVVGRRR